MTINKNKKTINNKTGGSIQVKDDPDKLNKDDYDSKIEDEEIEEDIEEEKEEDEEEEEEEELEDEQQEEQEEKEVVEKEDAESGDDECLYNLTKKKNNIDIDLEEGEDNFDDEEEQEKNKHKHISKYVKPEERVTKPFLFEFERVRILGERAKQISLGAKPMLKNIENYDPKMIARMELQNKILPLIILRELPDGRIEKWKVSELMY
jgi:DNA-directed RNA polymerase subunit K/omega